MSESFGETGARLKEALVAAFPEYLCAKLEERSVAVDDEVREAVDEGVRWLSDRLDELVSQPASQQRRGPLELVQEAVSFVTEVLGGRGVAPVERDAASEAAIPGDRYGLAPVTSRELGERAWRAHVDWGIAKAREVAGVVPRSQHTEGERAPVVVLVGRELMDRSKVESAVTSKGLAFEVWRNPGAVERGLADRPPVVAFVDLTHPAADDAVRRLAEAGVRVVAFGPHVDDLAMARARSLGAHEVLPRSKFFTRLAALVPDLT